MLIDDHAHLDYIPENKLSEVIKRSKEFGVKAIISNGTTPESNKKILDISKKYDIVKPALGIYPTHTPEFDIDKEIEFIRKNNPVAIGEVGLDFKENKNEEEKSIQKQAFQKFIDLAENLKIPIITHSRKAENEVVEMLETSKIKPYKIIMHCFSGKKALVKKIRDNGWMFSLPTSIVRTEHFQTIAKNTVMSQILTETDTPYLSPFKTNQNLVDETSEIDINEPANIRFSTQKIAEIKNLELAEVENAIFMNYQKTFL
ncbi:TatD family hydrolase [Candidatus Woesearchaeota archaeon]|nr:TatD family hydrolase [Candidatus Woesearchaeota archaeon]